MSSSDIELNKYSGVHVTEASIASIRTIEGEVSPGLTLEESHVVNQHFGREFSLSLICYVSLEYCRIR